MWCASRGVDLHGLTPETSWTAEGRSYYRRKRSNGSRFQTLSGEELDQQIAKL
jgi:hypothetical protein